MKKNVIALILSVVLASGSLGPVPVRAAETVGTENTQEDPEDAEKTENTAETEAEKETEEAETAENEADVSEEADDAETDEADESTETSGKEQEEETAKDHDAEAVEETGESDAPAEEAEHVAETEETEADTEEDSAPSEEVDDTSVQDAVDVGDAEEAADENIKEEEAAVSEEIPADNADSEEAEEITVEGSYEETNKAAAKMVFADAEAYGTDGKWTEVMETVHHDEEGHYEEQQTGTKKVVDKEAWDERITIRYMECTCCGFQTLDTTEIYDHIGMHMINGDEFYEYEDGVRYRLRPTWTFADPVYEYVHHDEEYHMEPVYENVWVVDREAYDEPTGTGVYKYMVNGNVVKNALVAIEGETYYLDGNGDKEGSDRSGYGRVEYAYHLMAREAGLEMTECRLWDGRHFMTRRFDRLPGGGKLHMQSLAALAHLDFNDPVSNSYEESFRVARAVTADARAEDQLFRRMCFNVLAWNCDDHVKNVAFLMDRAGVWSLAPAFDVTYAHNPEGAWTGAHQMSVNGKRRDIADDDLLAAARAAGLKPRRAREALDRVRAAVARWPDFANEANVRDDFAEDIRRQLAA